MTCSSAWGITDFPRNFGWQIFLTTSFLGYGELCDTPHIESLRQLHASTSHQLTKDQIAWEWTTDHQQTFSAVKEALTTAPVFAYFNPRERIKVHCDVSSAGIGAAIMQNSEVLAYASGALIPTGDSAKRYTNIEEFLGGWLRSSSSVTAHMAARSRSKATTNLFRQKGRNPLSMFLRDSNACYYNSRTLTLTLCLSARCTDVSGRHAL